MCLKEKIWRTIACAALLNNKLAPLAQESPSQNGLVAGRAFWRSLTMCLPTFCILAEGSAAGQSRRRDIVYQHFIQLRTASLGAFYPKAHNPAAHRCRSGDIQRVTVKETDLRGFGQSLKPHQPTVVCRRSVGNAGAALWRQSQGGRGTREAAVAAEFLLLGCLCCGKGELGKLSSVTQMASRCRGDERGRLGSGEVCFVLNRDGKGVMEESTRLC